MILFLSNGRQIRGDLISSAVLRSDLSPVPLTLEADIRGGDESIDPFLQEGAEIKDAADNGLHIVKSVRVSGRNAQGDHGMTGYRITALLAPCVSVAYVRSRAIIKESSTLGAIYKAADATVPAIKSDFPVPRFCCPVGETPSFHIARALQEEGGVVRWKNGRLQFLKLKDIFTQKAVRTIPSNAAETIDGGFLERHEVPWFFSLDSGGQFVFGNRAKPRAVRFAPFTNEQRLQNMTACLVTKKTAKIPFDMRICAGDVIEDEIETRYAVITAAHVFKSGSDTGGNSETYTKLWLGELEQ